MTQIPMTERLQTALETVLPGSVYPIINTGGGIEYFVWNYSTTPTVWADSLPYAARYLVQAHYYRRRFWRQNGPLSIRGSPGRA